VVFGTKADGSQGYKPVTDKTVSDMEKNRIAVQQQAIADARQRAGFGRTGREPQKDFLQLAEERGARLSESGGRYGSAGQDNIGGVSSPAPSLPGLQKGGLASKPKAKAKRKKNTKGLGTKPKAT
jgi:hypothetical protein